MIEVTKVILNYSPYLTNKLFEININAFVKKILFKEIVNR